MGTFFVPKTSVQTIPEIPINSRLTMQPGLHYTCPTGKKAVFKGYITCFSTGAAATAFIRSPDGSFNLATWANVGGNFNTIDNLVPGVPFFVEIQLEAGETITTDQNTGMNAEFEVVGSVKELPA